MRFAVILERRRGLDGRAAGHGNGRRGPLGIQTAVIVATNVLTRNLFQGWMTLITWSLKSSTRSLQHQGARRGFGTLLSHGGLNDILQKRKLPASPGRETRDTLRTQASPYGRCNPGQVNTSSLRQSLSLTGSKLLVDNGCVKSRAQNSPGRIASVNTPHAGR